MNSIIIQRFYEKGNGRARKSSGCDVTLMSDDDDDDDGEPMTLCFYFCSMKLNVFSMCSQKLMW